MYAFCCKDSDFYPLYGTKGRIVAATFPTFQACGKSCKHNALRTKKRRAARHCRHKKIITLMAQVPFGAAKRHFPHCETACLGGRNRPFGRARRHLRATSWQPATWAKRPHGGPTRHFSLQNGMAAAVPPPPGLARKKGFPQGNPCYLDSRNVRLAEMNCL